MRVNLSINFDAEAWFAEIPSHWQALRIAVAVSKNTNGYVGPTRDILTEEGIRYLQSLHIKNGQIRFNTPYFVSEEWSRAHAKSILKEGDVVVVQTGDVGQVAAVPKEFEGCNCHALIILRAKPEICDGFYLATVLNSHFGKQSLMRETTGALHPHLECGKIRDIRLPFPSPTEQRRIREFPDEQTAKIDRLMGLRRRQMELLREQRASLIQQAVTRGLNPNAAMKDSGLPWLGEIPAHWEMLRIATTVTKNTNGFVGPTRDILVEEGVRYLQSLHLKAGQIRFDKPYFVSEEWSCAHAKSILEEGDVLIVQTGDVGQVAAVPKEFEGCNCHALIILRMRSDLGSGFYLAMLFNSHFGKQTLMRETTGALLPHPECGKIRDIRLPFPPPDEQQEILTFIEQQSAKFDALLSAYDRQLTLLAEFRAALIHEAVTGQRQVGEATLAASAEGT